MRFLALLLIIISLSCFSLYAEEYYDVLNTSVSGTFELNHVVKRISFFKTIFKTAEIKQAGQTELGRFIIRNNTLDGYRVTITSTEQGVLAPSGTSETMLDGEVAIPYSITILKEGEVGTGVDSNYIHSSTDLAANSGVVTILEPAGNNVSSLTDAAFTLIVTISDESNILDMAGTYSDTLTLTYEDL